MEDTSGLEQQVREVLGTAEDEKIEIRTISAGVGTNKAVALTWIRAEVVDVIIGEEEQMTEYAQAGYLKDLGDTEAEQPDAFLCGLAEYDKEGNVTGTGPESCFGKYAGEIAGVQMKKPVAGLAGNASNLDNGLMLLNFFSEN